MPSTRDLVARGVELERPDDDAPSRVGGGPGGVAQRDAQPGVELVHAERLGHVVVGAALERLDLLALLVAARQDHDRRRRLAPDPPDDLRARRCRAGRGRAARRPAGAASQRSHAPCARRSPRRSGSRARRARGRAHARVSSSSSTTRTRRAGLGAIARAAHAGAARSRRPPARRRGRSMSIARPPSSLRRAATRPPIASTRPRTTARPIPVPERELRGRARHAVELLEQLRQGSVGHARAAVLDRQPHERLVRQRPRRYAERACRPACT